MKPNLSEATSLFLEYNSSDALIKHGLAVSAVMKHFAKIYNEDIEKWGVIGLLHDLDYIITETIMGMREAAEEIGLKGSL